MSARAEVVAGLLATLSTVDGLRPATPSLRAGHSWNLDQLAVDADPELVQIRLVATAMPLPPLLAEAGEVLAKELAGSAYAGATLRLVVADVDAAAFENRGSSGKSTEKSTEGP